MKLGVFHVAPAAAVDAPIVAKRAEELGFDSYWAADHTVIPVHSSVKYPGADPDGREPDYLWQIPDPLVLLASVAASTSRILLATGVCLVPERNAILLAKQVATLDQASGGRVLFGVGAGWNPEESTILGGDFEHRWTQIKESIRAMKALWCDDPSEHHGKYVDFPPVRCFPKPARKPHPPVLLGAISNPRSLRRVAEWGDGWAPILQSVEEFVEGAATIRRLAKEAGRDPAALDLTVFGMPGQWRTEEELAAFERAGATRLTFWLHEQERGAILRELEGLAKTYAKRLAG